MSFARTALRVQLHAEMRDANPTLEGIAREFAWQRANYAENL